MCDVVLGCVYVFGLMVCVCCWFVSVCYLWLVGKLVVCIVGVNCYVDSIDLIVCCV